MTLNTEQEDNYLRLKISVSITEQLIFLLNISDSKMSNFSLFKVSTSAKSVAFFSTSSLLVSVAVITFAINSLSWSEE